MKNMIKSLLALAVTALAITACSDVPEPYQIPGTGGNSGGGEVAGATGTGIIDDPFNCAAAIAKCKEIGSSESAEKYYVKGVVVTSGTADGTFGNVTFDMADVIGSSLKFKAFQVLGSDAKKLPEGYEVKSGDEVIVYGPIYNYNGKTPETAGKGAAYIYSINGKKTDGSEITPPVEGEDPKGTGTQSDPYNIAAAIKKCQEIGQTETSDKYYVKGIAVADAYPDATYGNTTIDLVDKEGSTDIFKAFQVLGSDGKKMPSSYKIAKGAEVVVFGPIYNYKGNTPETTGKGTAYIVTVNGLSTEVEGNSDTPTPSGDGEGTEAKPYDVPAAITKGEQAGVYLKAFIVGFVDGQVYAEGATFSAASTSQTNILIAASPDETDAAKCMPVQLPTGDIRTKLNLKDNADNYKKEVLLYGDITKYFSVPGLKNTSYAVINGNTIGTKPDGSDTPSGDVKAVSIADFNAAPENDNVWYQLTGTVKNLKENDQYGNFDLEDATGSVYVYGLLSEKGGAKKLFQELVAAKGIANGSKITIIGTRGEYNGKIEVMNAYFVSIEGDSSSSGSGADGSTIISVSDFNAAPESTTVWYQLTGTIKNLKDGDLYGNFDLEDNTGSVYVYGVLSKKGGAKKLFQELVAAKGIANGKKITIVGNRGSYNGKIEVTNAYFIKVE